MKKALENVGKNQTYKIKEYAFIGKSNLFEDEKGRINIFDTPGFSTNDDNLSIIKNKIKVFFSQYISNNSLFFIFLRWKDKKNF